jgi:hypothetical protein
MENNKDLTVTSTSEVVAEATAKRDLLNMAYKQAQFYASSTIVPAEYQNNPSNCFIAIEMANRMGANPFQVMQSLNVIKGKPSWSSAFIIAAVNQSGRFKTPINYQMKGDWSKGDLECVAWAISKDGTKCESIKVTQKMANAEGWVQKNGSKWQTMPELMIRYRAAAFFGRQYCPDLLLGLMTTEEQKDIIEADYEEVDAKIATEKVEEHQNKTMASVKVTVNENPETGEVKEEKVETEKVETPANEGIFNYEV